MSMLTVVAVAAAYGLEKVLADGYRVDQKQFDSTLRMLASLDRVLDPVTPVDAARNSPDNLVMATKDVSQAVAVGEHAVRKAARSGKLPGSQIDGRWQFTPDAVSEWEATRGN